MNSSNILTLPTELSSAAAEKASSSRSAAQADAELVRRFVGGDEAAFIEIVNNHRAKIFAAALAHLHDHGDAEEITQDTFIRAYRALPKFRGDSSLATWLHRIAVNLARNRYWFFHRRRRHATCSLDRPLSDENDATLSDLVSAETADPSQESSWREFSEHVADCLQELDPHHREILRLRNTELLAYEDISNILGMNVGTVKSRIARARKNLRNLLAARCPDFAQGVNPDDYFLPARGTGQAMLAAA